MTAAGKAITILWEEDGAFSFIDGIAQGHVSIEVDEETYARWERVSSEYFEMQQELQRLHRAGDRLGYQVRP